jgi:hypothetical protein
MPVEKLLQKWIIFIEKCHVNMTLRITSHKL